MNILNIVASIASIGGLWFSFWAWQRAKHAEEAAREARDAVRKADAAEDLNRIATKSKEMMVCIQTKQYTEARTKSADLVLEISVAITRWRRYLDQARAGDLSKARSKISIVSTALSELHGDISIEARQKLLSSGHEIAVRIAEVTGSIMEAIEKGESDGGTD